MESEVSVGVIGCGYWGPNLARNFARLPGCRLAALCDSDPERRNHVHSRHPSALAFADVDTFLEEGGTEAVVVATGPLSHAAIARACLKAGKHVCIEKPMAMSVADCDELIRLAEASQRVLMVGHTFLYSPPMRKVLEIVDSGELGAIRHVSCRRLNLGIARRDLHVLWDLAAHDLSIVLALFKESPEAVSCQGAANLCPGVPDVATLWLRFPGHRSATILNSWLNPLKTREISIVGSRQMVVYDDVAKHDKVRIFNSRVEVPPHFETFAEFHFAYHYGDVFTPHVVEDEPLRVECEHFVECVRRGQRPLTDAQQGREVVRILEAADNSMAREGVAVRMGCT